MPASPTLPAITCIRCGYTLAGLPLSAACPECATPAAASIKDDPDPPTWLELFIRTMLRPRVLWSEPLALHRAGLRMLVNTHLGMLGFAGAFGTYIGLAIFTDEWERAGPLSALVQAPVGLFAVAVIAAAITLLTGIVVNLGLLLGMHALTAVLAWIRPVRPIEHTTAVASCALYPMVAGALAAWAVVALTAVAMIVILAFGGTEQLKVTCGVTGGAILLAAAAASMIHSVVLAAWGALEPRRGSNT